MKSIFLTRAFLFPEIPTYVVPSVQTNLVPQVLLRTSNNRLKLRKCFTKAKHISELSRYIYVVIYSTFVQLFNFLLQIRVSDISIWNSRIFALKLWYYLGKFSKRLKSYVLVLTVTSMFSIDDCLSIFLKKIYLTTVTVYF